MSVHTLIDVATSSGSVTQSAISSGTVGQILTSNGPSSAASFQDITSGAFPWSDQSANFNAISNTGYFITSSCIAKLPASPSNGDVVKFFVDGSFVLTISASGTEMIQLSSNVSSAGGAQTSTQSGDSCTLVYRSTDNKWCSENFVGAWNSA